MPGAEVVAKAKSQGVVISLAYVYGIRAKSNAKKRSAAPAAEKRGPGRPRKVLVSPSAVTAPVAVATRKTNGARKSSEHRSAGGLITEIERIVEAKVAELLKARLGAIFN